MSQQRSIPGEKNLQALNQLSEAGLCKEAPVVAKWDGCDIASTWLWLQGQIVVRLQAWGCGCKEGWLWGCKQRAVIARRRGCNETWLQGDMVAWLQAWGCDCKGRLFWGCEHGVVIARRHDCEVASTGLWLQGRTVAGLWAWGCDHKSTLLWGCEHGVEIGRRDSCKAVSTVVPTCTECSLHAEGEILHPTTDDNLQKWSSGWKSQLQSSPLCYSGQNSPTMLPS